MIDLSIYQEIVQKGIKEINFPNKPNNLYQPLDYFLNLGGKRIRPILALMACELFGGESNDAKNAALSVELFHNFSLIHDDIMDKAPLRRGQETIHQKWDSNIAILSGDALLVKAYQFLGTHSAELLKPLLEIYNQTAIEVCEGQQYDMDFETIQDVSIDEYLNMIGLKTAVLLGCSLKMGAIIAKASEEDQDAIYQFGFNLGIAFQLQDDLLDVYADQNKFGKQVGGDIIANKKTFLLLKAIEDADSNQSKRIKKALNCDDNSKKIEDIKEIYAELEIEKKADYKISEFYQKSIFNLNQITASEHLKKPLTLLSDYLMNREN